MSQRLFYLGDTKIDASLVSLMIVGDLYAYVGQL